MLSRCEGEVGNASEGRNMKNGSDKIVSIVMIISRHN